MTRSALPLPIQYAGEPRTAQFEAFIYWVASEYQPGGRFVLSTSEPKIMEPHGWVLAKKHTFDVEIPADFDPRQRLVELLKREKEKARAEFAKRVADLDAQINNLLALEMSA